MTALIVIIAVGMAIGLVAASLMYIYPAFIINMLGGTEDGERRPIIGKEATSSSNGYKQVNVTLNGVVLGADISANNEQRTKGLSVKDGLAENEAMLFVFGNEGEHSFWMKNMKFPIDIIWINSNKTVVHIEHSLHPCDSELLCPTYNPGEGSLYVLETVGGFAEKHDVVQGTQVEFELNA
jgi:uncharacterized membrane protein (UPF0127 family)